MRTLLTLFVILLTSISTAYAQPNDEPPSYEEMYKESGFTNPNKAIGQFEGHYNKVLELPLRVPALAFTHQVGKFNNLEGDTNDTLEILFVSNRTPENHYKINVRHYKNAIKINERQLVDTYKLADGSIASYIKIGPPSQVQFFALVFQKDEWQYILSIDKRVTDTVTSDVLVRIANTL